MNNALRNGIKPTRFWHRTGQKHFESMIRDRENALPRPLSTRKMIDTLGLVGVALISSLIVAYTYGLMSPPRDLSKIAIPPCPKPVPKVCPKREKNKLPEEPQTAVPQACPENMPEKKTKK